jgi:hypothetical protein
MVGARSPSEWKARFVYWQRPASKTEEKKIDTIASKIEIALSFDRWLVDHHFRVISQGSYNNNTNVRNGSDVDLVVALDETYFATTIYGEAVPLEFMNRSHAGSSYPDFRAYVRTLLQNQFGSAAVSDGNKAIKVKNLSDQRITADVVPAFTYELYNEQNVWRTIGMKVLARGIAFEPGYGPLVTSYPEQHYDNGVQKNNLTNRRYKRVVRILKWIRDEMAETGFFAAPEVSSFLIECLVYNCQNHCFGRSEIYEDIQYVLQELYQALKLEGLYPTMKGMTEVSGMQQLFGPQQQCSPSQANNFVTAAWRYIGY